MYYLHGGDPVLLLYQNETGLDNLLPRFTGIVSWPHILATINVAVGCAYFAVNGQNVALNGRRYKFSSTMFPCLRSGLCSIPKRQLRCNVATVKKTAL